MVAAKLKIPAVCLVPTLVLTPSLLIAASKYLYTDYLKALGQPLTALMVAKNHRSLYSRFHLSVPSLTDLFINEENLNLVLTSRHLQPGGDSLDNNYQFIGPIIYDRYGQSDTLKLAAITKPIIYISLGTIYNQQLEFYRSWISYFSHTSYQVYISIGKGINPNDLGEIPENVVVKTYLPQLEILKWAVLFISHGGMNSVNESLYFGVPMLLFPQIHEQKINSARVAELGAGIWSQQSHLSEKSMDDMINAMMTNSIFKQNALKLAKTLQNAGGIQSVVSYLQTYLTGQKTAKLQRS